MYFFRKYRERIAVFLIVITLIVIVGYTSKERIAITKFEKLTGNLLTPISKITFSIGNKVTELFGSVTKVFSYPKENEALKERIIQLESENRDLLNLIGKTDYLKNELKMLESTDFQLVSAQIVSKEPGKWFHRFVIDKGLKDGIIKGSTIVQGVEIESDVYSEGIVGRVVDVGDNWAKITSIVDELNSISFKIIRTQDGGVLSGSVDGKVAGYLFDNKADVIVGDKLYTSGLGGTFKKDIYIGEVEEVIIDEEELIKRITVKPAIDFKKLYKVFAIIE